MKTQLTLVGSMFTGLLVFGLLVGCGHKDTTTATVTVNTAPVTNTVNIESPAVSVVTDTVSVSALSSSDSSANPLSDVQIRQKVVGTWKLANDTTHSITLNSDGSASSAGDGMHGTWKVTNGIFILTEDGPDGDNETNTVVRIDDHELILNEVGTGDVTRLHKQ